jgi:hypothetical protein
MRRHVQVGELTSAHWNNILHCAKLRGKTVDLTPQQVWDVFEQQNRRCALTGVLLKFEPMRQRVRGEVIYGNTTASLDRIDPDVGYQIGNIQWVHKDVNLMKRDFSTDRFREWCRLVAAHSPKP